MDDVPCWEIVASSGFGVARFTAIEGATFLEQVTTGGAVDGWRRRGWRVISGLRLILCVSFVPTSVHTSSAQQRLVGCVDDCIDLELGDVSLRQPDAMGQGRSASCWLR